MINGNWQSVRRLLCIRLDSLGDVLMTTPAIRAFKRARPDREVALLTSPAGSRLEGLLPDVDRFLVYEAPWMKAAPPRASAAADHELIGRLQAESFDAAVVFTCFSQSPLPAAMACYLAGVPLRLAYCRENPYQLLTDWVADDEPQKQIRHEVRRQLDLAAAAGCRHEDERLSLCVPGAARHRVLRMLDQRGLRLRRPWLVVHPGASAASRRYPAELFARVSAALVQRGFQLVFTGVESERPLMERIAGGCDWPVISLAGELELVEMAALLSIAPLLLANNTGPVHMAAALGRPVVDLYALTNPQHTPWQTPHRVLYHDVACKYCFKSACPLGHHRCLRGLKPESVVSAVIELYEESAAPKQRSLWRANRDAFPVSKPRSWDLPPGHVRAAAGARAPRRTVSGGN